MHRVHVPRVVAPQPVRQRGAKVISLEARRQARVEQVQKRQPPKHAA